MDTVEQIAGAKVPNGATARNAWARAVLRELFDAAVAAADPALVLAKHLPEKPRQGRTVVVGAGKASAAMAAAVEWAWPDVRLSGCVVVPQGYAKPCRQIHVREAGHPVPDARSLQAAEEIVASVRDLDPEDTVLAMISGGGSAVMCLPADGISLAEKQLTYRLLLRSGIDIRTMNAVRRRLSAIKGGRLTAAAAPAQVLTFVISDIPGDDVAAIASGPTLRDSTAGIDLSAVARQLGPDLPGSVRAALEAAPAAIALDNAAPPRILATAADALNAAAERARQAGIEPIILGDAIEGEARTVAQEMAARISAKTAPVVLLSGGETTVTVVGEAGQGGRNTEFLLALVIALEEARHVWALSGDTDGEDGANLGAAGAIAGPDTLVRARALGLDADAHLAGHDSGRFFAALDDLIHTGPTFTNVNDFRAVLVLPR